tara:strand:+ start:128546 stop:129214 length:669 start_codon:yes stop_codon:yes gene_type:complete
MAEESVSGQSSWSVREPQAFAQACEELLAEFPTLHLEPVLGGEELRGSFVVRDEGGALDTFKIRARLPAAFPEALPTIWETGQRLPHRPERHVNPDGSLCIMLPDEYWAEHEQCGLLAYLRGPVHDYFLGQLGYEQSGVWPGAEMAHGSPGRVQYYQRLLGTNAPDALRRLCDDLTADRLERQGLCPCGSKRKRRRCHGQQIARLRGKVSREDIDLVRQKLG